MITLETNYNILCKYCKQTKPKSEFHTKAKTLIKKTGRCRDCYHISQEYTNRLQKRNGKWKNNPEFRELTYKHAKKYRHSHRDEINYRSRERNRKIRMDVIKKYGNKCSCCGENRLEFLAIDHVNGGGAKEHAQLRSGGVYRKLLKNEVVLEDYQVLCHNCNTSKGHYGYCPHTYKYHLCDVCQHTPAFCRCPKLPNGDTNIGEVILREQIADFEDDIMSSLLK